MRNPLHAICPYFAMFPESFVQKQLLAHSRPGDSVFDPFCGRGTTILESILNDRLAIGSDINPVAACVAGAKAEIPRLKSVLARIHALRTKFEKEPCGTTPNSEFFSLCYSDMTLQQVLFLRRHLRWKTSPIDRFITAVLLGVLHGESHKTELCLSNRMPRTISTKPDYSVRWWKARDLKPPDRDAFEILEKMVTFRFSGSLPEKRGKVVLADSRRAAKKLKKYNGTISLVITSPPYIDTTDYAEDQWLRLWFLGGPETPSARLHKDDRHTQATLYWQFLREVWAGSAALLNNKCTIVIRIGGTKLPKPELFAGVQTSLKEGLENRTVRALHNGETSSIKRRQTNSFRPGTSADKLEHDFAFSVVA